MEREAPRALSWWFVLHFIIDISIALPLFLFPKESLELFGWGTVDPILTRVVAAALFGIGIESMIGRKATLDGFRNMLDLKIIWSFTATIGIGWAMLEGAQGRPLVGWCALILFLIFHTVWVYWRVRIGKLINNGVGPAKPIST